MEGLTPSAAVRFDEATRMVQAAFDRIPDACVLDLSDPIACLSYLFLGGPAPFAPAPARCGPDPTATNLGCEVG